VPSFSHGKAATLERFLIYHDVQLLLLANSSGLGLWRSSAGSPWRIKSLLLWPISARKATLQSVLPIARVVSICVVVDRDAVFMQSINGPPRRWY
jgi:hypothetical protein